jgi:16S rRNA (guanine527-N7)-methyltransferase
LRNRAEHLSINLGKVELERIEGYLTLLQRWNRKLNLTALPLTGFPDTTLDRLIWEPLVAAAHVEDSAALCWYDIGSGGGSPAIPLKIVRPKVSLTMVEPRERKGAFLREVVRDLGLASASVLATRLGSGLWSPAGIADLVTLRAVRLDDTLTAAVLALFRPEGRLFLFGNQSGQKRALRGFRRVERVALPSADAVLEILEKA